MDEFMDEDVDFPNAPFNFRGCSTSVEVSCCGNKATKKVTKMFKMSDGSQETQTITINKTFA